MQKIFGPRVFNAYGRLWSRRDSQTESSRKNWKARKFRIRNAFLSVFISKQFDKLTKQRRCLKFVWRRESWVFLCGCTFDTRTISSLQLGSIDGGSIVLFDEFRLDENNRRDCRDFHKYRKLRQTIGNNNIRICRWFSSNQSFQIKGEICDLTRSTLAYRNNIIALIILRNIDIIR